MGRVVSFTSSECEEDNHVYASGVWGVSIIGVMAAVAAVPVGDGVTIDFLTEATVAKDGVSEPAHRESEFASSFRQGVGSGDFAGMFMNAVSIHSATMRAETFVSMLFHAESVPTLRTKSRRLRKVFRVLQKHLCSEILRSTQTWQQQRLSC